MPKKLAEFKCYLRHRRHERRTKPKHLWLFV
jgi:hypothetical protein